MNDLEMASTFRRAADYLKEHGWQQFHAGERGGARCASGALRSAMSSDIAASRTDPLNIVWGVAGERVPATALNPSLFSSFDRLLLPETIAAGYGAQMALIQWNNTPGRTQEDVVALFEGLAHDLELRHQIAATTPVDTTVPITEQTAQPQLVEAR